MDVGSLIRAVGRQAPVAAAGLTPGVPLRAVNPRVLGRLRTHHRRPLPRLHPRVVRGEPSAAASCATSGILLT